MFIAIEGIDGSGKQTQVERLAERAASAGLSVGRFAFPSSNSTLIEVDSPFADAISDYLAGRFGDINAIPPYLIALLFAGDRFEMRDPILSAIATQDLVISDRYVASNLAHQGAKLSMADWDDFFSWVKRVEYGSYQMPKPDVTMYLDMPVGVARRRITSRAAASPQTTVEDFHEKDVSYLERCSTVYAHLMKTDSVGRWLSVPCVHPGGRERSENEIHDEIWSLLAEREFLAQA